jgi:hypothetical protein
MSSFAPAYSGGDNNVRLNAPVEDIIVSNQRDAICARVGQDYDNDAVDASEEDLAPEISSMQRPIRMSGAPVSHSRSNASKEVYFDLPAHPGVILEEPDTQYPSPLPLALIVLGICLSVFVISLDRTIVTTVRAAMI